MISFKIVEIKICKHHYIRQVKVANFMENYYDNAYAQMNYEQNKTQTVDIN